MHKRMTITIDEEVYDGLVRVIGRRKISQFLEDPARPHLMQEDLASAYQARAADTEREREALAKRIFFIGTDLNLYYDVRHPQCYKRYQRYQNIHRLWLRWYDTAHQWFPPTNRSPSKSGKGQNKNDNERIGELLDYER